MTFIVTRQRAQEVHDRARARAGLPYAYGGAFTEDPRRSTDCSGLVLQTAAWYGGRTDWPGNRYGSTESFRLDDQVVYNLGFKRMPAGGPAALPFKPVMLVGLQHGGGGENSHTACTLMTMDIPGGPVKMSDRGVDWESQGDGVFLYDGARAWNDRLFHDFWYLDAQLEAAPDDEPGPDAVEVLRHAMEETEVSDATLAEYLPHFTEAMRAAEITTVNRAAAFGSQVGHESAGLKYMAEIQTDGPDWSWDRKRYRGRGPIQLTWQSNYRKFGNWCVTKGYITDPELFVDQPELVERPRWGFLAASWYWLNGGPRPGQINGFADAGDILAVSRCVNGWIEDEDPVGYPDRKARWRRCLAVGDALLALAATPTPTDPFEELLMSDLRVPSASIYATPGEPDVPIVDMIRALDAHGPHEPYVEKQARAGDLDALMRVARTAAGLGPYGSAPGPVAQAQAVLDDIEKTNPAVLQAFLAQNGASK